MSSVAVLGIYVADLAFLSARMPLVGETVAGSGFRIGPGGKGGNQAVAAARAGARTAFITKIGNDDFGRSALAMWEREGLQSRAIIDKNVPTGAAFIYVNEQNGDNAVLVVPGASGTLTPEELERERPTIEAARIFITQLETPAAVGLKGLEIARAKGVTTLFNPAPAVAFDPAMLALADYCTPNESETEALTGIAVTDLASARAAADVLLKRGVKNALITLGANGALLHNSTISEHIAPFSAGRVVDTTGAGDAFNGGFAAALAEGLEPLASARFASATAGLAVTRAGTAAAMPGRADIDALLREHP